MTPEEGVQTTPLEGMAPETFLDVERFQHYGITTVPPEGAMAIYADERASFILKKGTILETTCNEWHLKCKKAVIKASDSMMVKTPQVTATLKVTVQRPLTGQSDMSVGGDNDQGSTATIIGNINHASGTIYSVKIGTHKHDHPGRRIRHATQLT